MNTFFPTFIHSLSTMIPTWMRGQCYLFWCCIVDFECNVRNGNVRMTKVTLAIPCVGVWCVYLTWFLALFAWAIAPLKHPLQMAMQFISMQNNRTSYKSRKCLANWHRIYCGRERDSHWNFSINTGIFDGSENIPSAQHRLAPVVHGSLHQYARDGCHSLEWYFSRFNCISHQTSPISRLLLPFSVSNLFLHLSHSSPFFFHRAHFAKCKIPFHPLMCNSIQSGKFFQHLSLTEWGEKLYFRKSCYKLDDVSGIKVEINWIQSDKLKTRLK